MGSERLAGARGGRGEVGGGGGGAQVTLGESARNCDEFFVGGGKNIEEVGAEGRGATEGEGASNRR